MFGRNRDRAGIIVETEKKEGRDYAREMTFQFDNFGRVNLLCGQGKAKKRRGLDPFKRGGNEENG